MQDFLSDPSCLPSCSFVLKILTSPFVVIESVGSASARGGFCYHLRSRSGALMARGVIPRQPAKAGRQDRTGQSARGRAARNEPANARAKAGVSRKSTKQIGAPNTRAAKVKRLPPAKVKPVKPRGYNPTASDRVQAILKHLDELYPEAVCALHHKNAWELLVATILSA